MKDDDDIMIVSKVKKNKKKKCGIRHVRERNRKWTHGHFSNKKGTE